MDPRAALRLPEDDGEKVVMPHVMRHPWRLIEEDGSPGRASLVRGRRRQGFHAAFYVIPKGTGVKHKKKIIMAIQPVIVLPVDSL